MTLCSLSNWCIPLHQLRPNIYPNQNEGLPSGDDIELPAHHIGEQEADQIMRFCRKHVQACAAKVKAVVMLFSKEVKRQKS